MRPTPLTIRKLQLELYNNAQAITSPLGIGAHGHLDMLMTITAYIALHVQYNFPNHPALPNYASMTANDSANAQEDYKEEHQQFTEAHGFHTRIKCLPPHEDSSTNVVDCHGHE